MIKNSISSASGHTLFAIALTLIGIAPHAIAQAPSRDLAFEVATVKAVDPSRPFDPAHHWVHLTPARASYWYMTLNSLIAHAYDIRPFQITAPDWINADDFDIEATFPQGADKKDEPRMLQSLLKDRFKLSFHITQQDLEGYVLVAARSGATLKPSPPDPPPAASSASNLAASSSADPSAKPKVVTSKDGSTRADLGPRGTFLVRFDQETWTQHLERSKMTMEELAGILGTCLGEGGHKVIDQTGLAGTYQVALDCPIPRPRRPTSPTAGSALPSDPQDGSALIRSLDAMGLKLEKRKIPTDIYNIDHVETPSQN